MVEFYVLIHDRFVYVYFQNIFYSPQLEYHLFFIRTTGKQCYSMTAYKTKMKIRDFLNHICFGDRQVGTGYIVDLADDDLFHLKMKAFTWFVDVYDL